MTTLCKASEFPVAASSLSCPGYHGLLAFTAGSQGIWTDPAVFGLPELRARGCYNGISWSHGLAELATKFPPCPRSLAWPLQPGGTLETMPVSPSVPLGLQVPRLGEKERQVPSAGKSQLPGGVDEMSWPWSGSGRASWSRCLRGQRLWLSSRMTAGASSLVGAAPSIPFSSPSPSPQGEGQPGPQPAGSPAAG